MRVILQGSLEHFGGKELLLFLAGTSDGTLDAESGGARLRVAFRDGHIVAAEGNGDAAGVVAKFLGCRDGTFTYLDGVVLPEGAPALALHLATVIARAEECLAVVEFFPSESITFRVINRPPGEISLTAEEFQILFQIGTGKSLSQLRVESGRAPVDLYPTVRRLQLTGLIEVVSDSGVTARGTTPAPPPPRLAPMPASAPPQTTEDTEHLEPMLIGTLTANDGTMHPLLDEASTIGRTPANAIALPDPSVSACHAVVERTAGGFVIEDAGSRNGTYVNSEKLSGKRLLEDGDLVRFGKIILTFNLAADLKRKQSTEREMMT